MHLSVFSLLALLPLFSAPVLAQDDQLDCPDGTLTTYLISLIDTLYNNGLTIYEELLAKISETDQGYKLLSSWYSDTSLTLLIPTDSAFQMAGIWGPFNDQTTQTLVDIIALHTLQGTWAYENLPNSPLHGVASTLLSVAEHANSTTQSGAFQAMVMQQGDGNAVVVKTAYGNTTTWSGALDLGGTGLNNMVVLPVDHVSC